MVLRWGRRTSGSHGPRRDVPVEDVVTRGFAVAHVGVLAVVDEPRSDDALRLGVLLGHLREGDFGDHAIRSLTAAAIRSRVGRIPYSNVRAYGIGTSGTASRLTGLVSIVGSVSATIAAISPDTPKLL